MKNKCFKIILTLGLFMVSLGTYAQLNGMFNYAQDGHIYFFLSNATRFPITVNVAVRNNQTSESRTDRITIRRNEQFVFGPNANWMWKQGEVFIVTYQNGQSVYWTCPQNDNSFITPEPTPPVANNNSPYSVKERKELENEEKLKKGMEYANDYDYALSQVRNTLRDLNSSMFKQPLSNTASAMYVRLKTQLRNWQQKMYNARIKAEGCGYKIQKAPEETATVK